MNKRYLFLIILTQLIYVNTILCSQDEVDKTYHTFENQKDNSPRLLKDEELKNEILKWAIKELTDHNCSVDNKHSTEKKRRIFATVVALLTTTTSIVLPIITYYFSNADQCSKG